MLWMNAASLRKRLRSARFPFDHHRRQLQTSVWKLRKEWVQVSLITATLHPGGGRCKADFCHNEGKEFSAAGHYRLDFSA